MWCLELIMEFPGAGNGNHLGRAEREMHFTMIPHVLFLTQLSELQYRSVPLTLCAVHPLGRFWGTQTLSLRSI